GGEPSRAWGRLGRVGGDTGNQRRRIRYGSRHVTSMRRPPRSPDYAAAPAGAGRCVRHGANRDVRGGSRRSQHERRYIACPSPPMPREFHVPPAKTPSLLQVHKFGGASLADAASVRHAASIIAGHKGPRLVVASAMAGVTDAL